MSREHVGWLLWGSWLLLFLIPEALTAFGAHVPWPTLSRTVWALQQRWPWLTIPILGLLAWLIGHIVRVKGIQEGDPVLVAEVEGKLKPDTGTHETGPRKEKP